MPTVTQLLQVVERRLGIIAYSIIANHLLWIRYLFPSIWYRIPINICKVNINELFCPLTDRVICLLKLGSYNVNKTKHPIENYSLKKHNHLRKNLIPPRNPLLSCEVYIQSSLCGSLADTVQNEQTDCFKPNPGQLKITQPAQGLKGCTHLN